MYFITAARITCNFLTSVRSCIHASFKKPQRQGKNFSLTEVLQPRARITISLHFPITRRREFRIETRCTHERARAQPYSSRSLSRSCAVYETGIKRSDVSRANHCPIPQRREGERERERERRARSQPIPAITTSNYRGFPGRERAAASGHYFSRTIRRAHVGSLSCGSVHC